MDPTVKRRKSTAAAVIASFIRVCSHVPADDKDQEGNPQHRQMRVLFGIDMVTLWYTLFCGQEFDLEIFLSDSKFALVHETCLS
jgi:hypothetical protein